MNIRFATQKDKKQIFKLLDEFSLLRKAKDIPSVVGGKIFDEVISKKDAKIFVAEKNSKLIGTVTLHLLPNIRHGYYQGYLEHFFVTKDWRSKGIGTALFETVKDYCRKNNISVIKLHSGNELKDAHKFYEAQGGKTTERFFRFDIKP